MNIILISVVLISSQFVFAGGTQGGGVGVKFLSVSIGSIQNPGIQNSVREPKAVAAPRERGIPK